MLAPAQVKNWFNTALEEAAFPPAARELFSGKRPVVAATHD